MAAYSKGMRQRIMLIAALLHHPEVLILDEPFSGLDVTTSLTVREVLKMLAQSGKAIFFASPAVESFEQVCTHVLLLRNGEQVAYGTVEEVTALSSSRRLEGAFLNLAEDVDGRRPALAFLTAFFARPVDEGEPVADDGRAVQTLGIQA